MADAFDALMKSIADEADAKVDYAVMHAAVLQKAAAVRRRRAQFVRYGAMAATLVVLAGVGTLFLQARGDAARSGENAAPQAVEFSMGGQAADMAPEGAPEEPALGCVPESVCPTEKAGDAAGVAPSAGASNAARNEAGTPEVGISGHVAQEPLIAMSADELVSLCLAARTEGGALASFEWLYEPASAGKGYRLLEIAADASGITYTYNRAAADTHDDEYSIFIPAASLSGMAAEVDTDGVFAPAEHDVTAGAAGALTWALGGGEAALTPRAGCTLKEAELREFCALRLVEIK